MDSTYPLELSEARMRALVDAAMERITALIRTLPEQPVNTSGAADPEFLSGLIEPLPEAGAPFEELLDLVFAQAARDSLNPISPGFMGYVPGGGIFHAALADLIANVLNRYVGIAAVAPAMSQLEANVIRWFGQIVGYPASARGFLTSGGSLANWSALVTAREARLGENFSRGVIYLSDQAHHCVEKAARLAGFRRDQLRVLETDGAYRLHPDSVREAIEKDRRAGLKPFLIAASAGTTNSGAVDPLPALAELSRAEGLWFHIDAAYGGFFCLTERGRRILEGIAAADSLVLDPHKTLFLPYGTGALLVRDGRHLKNAHSAPADYLPPLQDSDELIDFSEISPELTRPFRGLRVWLALKLAGAQAFRSCLDEKLDLARWLEQQIGLIPALEVLAPPELSILAFALKDDGGSLDRRNAATRSLMQSINARQRVHLTGTRLHGVFAIRVAIGVFRTHREHLEVLLEDLHAALEESGLGH